MNSTKWWAIRATAVSLSLLALAGCSSSTTPDPDAHVPAVSSVAGAVPRPDHVLVVLFENKGYSEVIGNSQAPYLNSLATSGANFTNAHGLAHPSQPNYVALLSGATQGVTDDACPQNLGNKPNLARQLLDAGLSFGGYSESMPADGFTGCSSPDSQYARKHNPWVDFSNVPASDNRTFQRLPTDLSTLPTVSFLIPNMCNDMHDCPVSTGDTWASRTLPTYVNWAKTHNSLLVVTFDEDNGTNGNRIPTMLIGPMVRPGNTNQDIDHYNLLRTIEDMYGLPPLGAAASAHPITGSWTRTP
jgi:phosphatidylinositol-3-phosphatase